MEGRGGAGFGWGALTTGARGGLVSGAGGPLLNSAPFRAVIAAIRGRGLCCAGCRAGTASLKQQAPPTGAGNETAPRSLWQRFGGFWGLEKREKKKDREREFASGFGSLERSSTAHLHAEESLRIERSAASIVCLERRLSRPPSTSRPAPDRPRACSGTDASRELTRVPFTFHRRRCTPCRALRAAWSSSTKETLLPYTNRVPSALTPVSAPSLPPHAVSTAGA